MLQSLSKSLKVITKNRSRRTNERQKHLTGVCFHFIKSQLLLYSHLLLNLKKTIRNQSKRRICLMRSNKLKKQRKKMNHLKKMRLKEKKRVLKKNQILKIFATEEESLILLRNTNKSQPNSIRPKRMQSKNTMKCLLNTQKTRRKKCTNLYFLKETIIL